MIVILSMIETLLLYILCIMYLRKYHWEYYASSRDEEIATQLLARRCWSICEVQQGVPVIPSHWVDCLKDQKDESTKKSRLEARGDRDQSEHDESAIYTIDLGCWRVAQDQ